MKSDHKKKLREWLHVRHLHELLDVVPAGELDEDGERPDFIIKRFDGRSLGIEVTEYHVDVRKMARTSEQERVVAAARAEHWRRFGVPLMVRVYWNNSDRVDKRERSSLIEALVNAVASNTPRAGERIVLDTEVDDALRLPAHVDRIDIDRFDEDPDIDWICVRSGWVPDLSEAELRAEIERKSRLVADFRPVDELWLVIVYGGRQTTTWVRPTEAALTSAYGSDFDRIFLASYAPRTACELRAAVGSP